MRSAQKLREVLWPKLDLVVVTDIRMSSTARFADYVLPVAASYEKANASSFINQFLLVHAAKAAVERAGDSKDEWEIACLLAAKIQERAKERGISTFTGRRGETQRLDRAYDVVTREGEFGAKDAEKLARLLIENSTNLDTTSFEAATARGWAKVTSLGRGPINAAAATDWAPDETITPLPLARARQEAVADAQRARAVLHRSRLVPRTRRGAAGLQGAAEGGGRLPAADDRRPHALEHPLAPARRRADAAAAARRAGALRLRAGRARTRHRGLGPRRGLERRRPLPRTRKVSPAIRPGQVVMYHAWEDYQFEGGIGHRNVLATPLNPLGLVGGYPYLDPTFGARQPGMNDRDTRVEIRKV